MINNEYGVAMGVKRGVCQESGCNCTRYKAVEDDEEGGGVCVYCGHFPGIHENLGVINLSTETQTPADDQDFKVFYADSDPLGLLAAEDTNGKGIDTRSQLEDVCEWTISGNELKFLEKLGSGRSATVYKGLYKDITVAIKVLKESLEPKELANFKGELDIMRRVKSNHVVNFYGGCLRPKICLVMEYCSNGSLFHLLQRKDFFISWAMFFRLATEMGKGVQALHCMDPPVVHRDLKSLNLLVNGDYQVKVCDFGLSRYLRLSADDSTLHKMRGTYAYSAPEVYFGEKYSTKSDVFSTGMILWEIVSRVVTGVYQRPFKEFKIDFQIIIASAKKGRRPDIDPKTPASLSNLISKCWDAKPENRPTIDGILEAIVSIESEYRASPGEWDAILDTSTDANILSPSLNPSPSPSPSPSIDPLNGPSNAPSPLHVSELLNLPHLRVPVDRSVSAPNGMAVVKSPSDQITEQPSSTTSNVDEEGKERLSASMKRRASFSRSASKIFQRTKLVDDKKDDKPPDPPAKISIGQLLWQHRGVEDLLTPDGYAIKEEEKIIQATATNGWKRMGDDWKNEDAFEDDKKKDKKKGILGRLMKKKK